MPVASKGAFELNTPISLSKTQASGPVFSVPTCVRCLLVATEVAHTTGQQLEAGLVH